MEQSSAPTHPVPKKEVRQFQISIPLVYFSEDDTDFLNAVQLPDALKTLVDEGTLQLHHTVSLLAFLESTTSDEFANAALGAIIEFGKEVAQQKTGLILPDSKNKSGLVVMK